MDNNKKPADVIKIRDEQITLLEEYSLFLEKNGYMDTDWRTEAPYAIDQFFKERERT